MRLFRVVLCLALCPTAFVRAQQKPLDSPLLDHLVGKWVLHGEVAGQQTTHDVEAGWVLHHQYLEIREVSREKDQNGKPQYEATVYVGWNEPTGQYAAVWLDTYGGISPGSIGIAERRENQLTFIFKNEKGAVTFRNAFVYDQKENSWAWSMDNVEGGISQPFGRFTLTRP
jgi:hypothetical protein